jgi:two-component system, chemotaxis family, chemotaxis protein CheY
MANIRFLVVDDSATMRRIVINTLKTIGYSDVVEAGDGSEALVQLQAHDVQFIITDWNMPNMSGLELTKSVRADGKFQHLPILMVTTRGVKDDIVEALQAKVNSYIVKPFTPPVLKEKIDQMLKLAAA